MDFNLGLPRTHMLHNSILAMADRFYKIAHSTSHKKTSDTVHCTTGVIAWSSQVKDIVLLLDDVHTLA